MDPSTTPERDLKRERALARKLPLDFLQCRMIRHTWRRFNVQVERKRQPKWGTPVGFRCTTCGTERVDVIDRLGNLSWRNYTYPDDYTMPGGRPPGIDVVRVEWLRRIRREQTA